MEQNPENSFINKSMSLHSTNSREKSPADWDYADDFNEEGDFADINQDKTKENVEEEIPTTSQPKFNNKKSKKTKEQDAISTLLSTFCESAEEVAENFAKQNIGFKDLSSLTKNDLKLLGVDDNHQQNLLEIFEELPKQSPNYAHLTNSEETKNYNNKVLSANIDHLKTMTIAASATDLKLKVSQVDDVVVPDEDEEEFASTYVLQALDELKRIIDEIDDRVALLEEAIEEKTKEKSIFDKVLIATGITVVSFAYLIWRRNH